MKGLSSALHRDRDDGYGERGSVRGWKGVDPTRTRTTLGWS